MSIGMNRCKVCSSPAFKRRKRMLLGMLLTVACTNMLVTLAKGWLCWDDDTAVQEFSNGYICLEFYQTVHFEVFIFGKLS